jgi:hypothetical protein
MNEPIRVRLTVLPVGLDIARRVVAELHRHHTPPQGHKFSLQVLDDAGTRHGVAIIGRPVARALDTGLNLEVTRVATDGTPNACSALYAAAWRSARAQGYQRLVTYTQAGESGASLRGAGWRRVAMLPPRSGWDTPSRRRTDRGVDGVARVLWEAAAAGADALPALPRNGIRNEMLAAFTCRACGEPIIRTPGPGRPPLYCGTACRVRAHRRRQPDALHAGLAHLATHAETT